MTPLENTQVPVPIAVPEPTTLQQRSKRHWLRVRSASFVTVVNVVGLSVALFFFGFVLFAVTVMRDLPVLDGSADGIVVLTGGDFRILEGARLLREGRARHLLISGVNPKTSRDDLLKLTGLSNEMFDCCVELGYAAQDTVGNAEEARIWVIGRKMERLIVVTSSYHMLRSLAELELRLPGVVLIANPVVSRTFRNRAWWLNFGATRILLSEYVKYVPVAVRLETIRYLATWVDAAISTAQSGPN